jgi:hypothetical protein
MNNLPSGAEQDPRAPWNVNHNLCKYCDSEEIRENFIEQNKIGPDDEVDEVALEEYSEKHPICDDCYDEMWEDMDDRFFDED